MGELLNFYKTVLSGRLKTLPTTNTVSEALDLSLVVDLASKNRNDQEKSLKSNHVNQEMNPADNDELSIGCEEDETSVNLYVKVQKAQKPKKNLSRIARKKVKTSKQFDEQFKKEEQDDVVRVQVKQNSVMDGIEPGIELPPEKCPMCPFEASTKDLHEHMKSCIRTKGYNCLDCPFSTPHWTVFQKHKADHSLKDAVYKCPKCTFGGKKHFTVNQHKQLHEERLVKGKVDSESIYQCPLCPFANSFYKTRMHFRLHAKENEHFKDILECPLCALKIKRLLFGKHTMKYHIKLKSTDHIY